MKKSAYIKYFYAPKYAPKVLTCLLFILIPLLSINSQCLPPDPGNLPQWYQGTTVYYTIDVDIQGDQRNQLLTAINRWDTSNSTENCSNVSFSEGVGASYEFDKLTFLNSNVNAAGQISPPAERVAVGDTLIETKIYLNPDFRLQPSNNLFYDQTQPGYSNAYTKVAMHEIGHTMGLTHYTDNYSACSSQIPQSSIMNGKCGVNDNFYTPSVAPDQVKSCDNDRLNSIYTCTSPTPPPPAPSYCADAQPFNGTSCPTNFFQETDTGYYCCRNQSNDPCAFPECWDPIPGCTCYTPELSKNNKSELDDLLGFVKPSFFIKAGYESVADNICTCPVSPIVVDILGNGYDMTNIRDGIKFDFNGDGKKRGKLSWTAAGTDDAWLVLDRNGNGTIENGMELFGNATPQPESIPRNERNGFHALAEFDKPDNGGDGNGRINRRDRVFADLRLWQDFNHNGISEPQELKPLLEFDVVAIDLDFQVSDRTDRHGNQFRYRARVRDSRDASVGRWAWDVFLLSRRAN